MSVTQPMINTRTSDLHTEVELKKDRLNEINFLQTFGIILVVLGHSHPLNVTYPPFYQALWIFLYSFHMPLFICISGYLFQYTGGIKNSYRGFLGKKAIRLLLPYIVISSILYIPKVVFLGDYSSRAAFALSSEAYLRNLFYPRFNVLGHFWFLPTLFIIFTISPILHKLVNGRKLIVIITTMVLVILTISISPKDVPFLNLSEVANLLIYFWVGCLLAVYRKHVSEIAKGKYYFPLIFAVITFFANPGIITGLMGILMSFSIAFIYMKNKSSFFKHLDGYSYQIYLLHWPIQAILFVILYQKFHLGFYTTALFMLLVGIVSPVIISKLTMKYIPLFKKIIGL